MPDERPFARFAIEGSPGYVKITSYTTKQLDRRLGNLMREHRQFAVHRLRSIRGELQRDIDQAKEKERDQNPQHAKLTRGIIIGLEMAFATVDQVVLTLEKEIKDGTRTSP